MAARMYSVSFADVAVSAIQDIFQLSAASNVGVRIHQVRIGCEATVSEALRIRIARATAGTVTGGPTPRQLDTGFAAADSSWDINDLTPLTIGNILWEDWFNLVTGFNYFPTPETRPFIPGGGLFVINAPVAPAAAVDMSGTVIFEEIG